MEALKDELPQITVKRSSVRKRKAKEGGNQGDKEKHQGKKKKRVIQREKRFSDHMDVDMDMDKGDDNL